jgi:Ca2+-binding EF-hand superfamily protein
MSMPWKTIAGSACLAVVLATVNVAKAQSQPATRVPATAPASPVGPDALFDSWDKDHNKALSLDEFKAGLQQAQTASALRQLHDNFVAKDTNKNGSLDAAEYANLELIKQAGTSAPPMTAFDADKSQGLDFKEYVAMVNALLKKR